MNTLNSIKKLINIVIKSCETAEEEEANFPNDFENFLIFIEKYCPQCAIIFNSQSRGQWILNNICEIVIKWCNNEIGKKLLAEELHKHRNLDCKGSEG